MSRRMTSDVVIAARLTLRARLHRRWTDFEARHRRLADDLLAAFVTMLVAIELCSLIALLSR